MKRFCLALLAVLVLTIFAYSQSGRRITPAPKSSPVASEASDEPDFSESIPVKTRITATRPVMRSAEPSAPGEKTESGPPATGESEGDVIAVETNLITIPVSVYDRNGLYIPNLKQDDFKIYEDGKEQKIAYFATTDKPFTVILMIDTSPSTAYKIEEIRHAAKAFVDQLKPVDNVLVISFDFGVHVHGDVTNDREAIYKAIDKANFGDGTSLYDAVDVALRKKLSKIEGRKAIVLFTDGVDTTSRKGTYDSTLDEAEESEAMIFPIYFNTFFDAQQGTGGIFSPFPIGGLGGRARGTSSGDYALGRQYLNDLATYTGGRLFRPEATPGGLTTAFEGIAEELRRQYNIGYVPQEEGKLGQRKQIKVRVDRPSLVVRNRDSYIVGTTSKPSPAAAATTKQN